MAQHLDSRQQVLILTSREWNTIVHAIEYTMTHENRGKVADRCRQLLRDFNRLGWEHQKPEWMTDTEYADWLRESAALTGKDRELTEQFAARVGLPIPVGPPDWETGAPSVQMPEVDEATFMSPDTARDLGMMTPHYTRCVCGSTRITVRHDGREFCDDCGTEAR